MTQKLKHTIWGYLTSLLDDTFDEKEVKLIFVEMREFINELNYQCGKSNQEYVHLLDVCDCIAHPYKQKGFVVNNLNEHIKFLEGVNSISDIPTKITPYGNVYFDSTGYQASKIIKTLLSTIQQFLDATDKPLTNESIDFIIDKRLHNISLCILSIFQNLNITYNKSEHPAQLYIGASPSHSKPNEAPCGQLGLFCYITEATFLDKLNTPILDFNHLYFGVFTSPLVTEDLIYFNNHRNRVIFHTVRNQQGYLSLIPVN